MYPQRRLRSAWAYTKTDQTSLHCPHEINWAISYPLSTRKPLISLGRSESLRRTCHIVGFVMRLLIYCSMWLSYGVLQTQVWVFRACQPTAILMASCKSALNRSRPHPPHPPVVYSTDRSKAMVLVLVFLFGALWFILRGDLLCVLPCAILFLCFSVLLALRLPRLGKRELILVFFVRLFDLCLFGFVGFLFLLISGKGCGLWLWHSLDFSLTFFGKTVLTRGLKSRAQLFKASLALRAR